MGKPKLMYFNGRGRCEPIRLLFAAGKVSYEDVRIPQDEWLKLKPNMPYGSLPVLEVGDVKIGQSLAVARYVAKITKLYGRKHLEEAQIDAIVDAVNGIREEALKCVKVQEPEEKAKIIGEAVEYANPLLDKLAVQLGNKNYFVGNKLSWADIHFYGCFELLFTPLGMTSLLDNHPTLKALYDRVAKNSNIEKYIKNRPETQF